MFEFEKILPTRTQKDLGTKEHTERTWCKCVILEDVAENGASVMDVLERNGSTMLMHHYQVDKVREIRKISKNIVKF